MTLARGEEKAASRSPRQTSIANRQGGNRSFLCEDGENLVAHVSALLFSHRGNDPVRVRVEQQRWKEQDDRGAQPEARREFADANQPDDMDRQQGVCRVPQQALPLGGRNPRLEPSARRGRGALGVLLSHGPGPLPQLGSCRPCSCGHRLCRDGGPLRESRAAATLHPEQGSPQGSKESGGTGSRSLLSLGRSGLTVLGGLNLWGALGALELGPDLVPFIRPQVPAEHLITRFVCNHLPSRVWNWSRPRRHLRQVSRGQPKPSRKPCIASAPTTKPSSKVHAAMVIANAIVYKQRLQ